MTSLPPSIQNEEGQGTYSTVLATVLLEIGVFALSREKRFELAASLDAEGISAQDLRNLRDYLFECIDTAGGKAQRVLAGKLTNAFGRKEMFDDLAVHLAIRKAMDRSGSVPPADIGYDYGEAIRKRDMEQTRRFLDSPATDRPLMALIESWKKKTGK